MTVALRFLPANIKLYGLGGYALTATFAPSLGIPLAAFCTETLGWRWTFWLVIPPAAVAAVMVWRGCRRTRSSWSASVCSTGAACCWARPRWPCWSSACCRASAWTGSTRR